MERHQCLQRMRAGVDQRTDVLADEAAFADVDQLLRRLALLRVQFVLLRDRVEVLDDPIAQAGAVSRLEQQGQVVFRYCDVEGRVRPNANPNGSIHNIAGIVNSRGNVLGMMPHPERCAEAELGGTDGLKLFRSVMHSAVKVLAG